MFSPLTGLTGNAVGIKLTDRITHADFEQFKPLVEAAIKEHGKIRVLFEMIHITGVDLQAIWDDTKFEMTHMKHIEKCAVVGDKKWEQFMTGLCKPFYSAKIQYFDITDFDKAVAWVNEPA